MNVSTINLNIYIWMNYNKTYDGILQKNVCEIITISPLKSYYHLPWLATIEFSRQRPKIWILRLFYEKKCKKTF